MSWGACSSSTRTPLIRCAGERQRCFVLANPTNEEWERTKVDGCAIATGQRCDYLLRKYSNAKNRRSVELELFVELKGSDVAGALQQIEATISAIGSQTSHKKAVVVCSRVPSETTTSQVLRRRFAKQHQIVPKVICRKSAQLAWEEI